MDIISEKVIRSMLEVDSYVTTATLADMTGLSVSSIKHNLNWVREELERFDIILQSTPKKGFCLIATEEQRLNMTQHMEQEASEKTESYVFRKGYILDTLFQFPANYTIQLFSEELSVSRNMIQKDLEQIEKELEKFHVAIKKIRNQGVVIRGEEFNIRQAIIEHNNSKYWKWNPSMILDIPRGVNERISKKAYTYLSNTYTKEKILEIQQILLETEEWLGITITDIDFCRVIEYLAITEQRIKAGNMIRKSSREEELLDLNIQFIEAAKLIFYKILPASKEVPKLEIRYLAARLFVCSGCGSSYIKGSGEYDGIATEYLESIENMLGFSKLSKSKGLVHEISLAFEQAKVRENYQILAWSDLHRDIQKQLSGLYAVCLTHIFMVEEYIETMLRQDDVAWIALLIHNFINDTENKVKVIFVHATTKNNAIYQKRKIEEKIPEIQIEQCFHFMEIAKSLYATRLVISTVPCRKKQETLLEVTKHISDKDIIKVKQWMEEFEEHKQDKAVKELLSEVYDEMLMIPMLKARTKEEAITKMSQVLIEQGYADEGFCEKILEREAFCPTSIGKGIAIPHHYKEHIIKSGIVVAKLKHRIIWQKVERVDLIFLIANNFEESEKVQMLFKYLYELIEDEKKIEQLRQARNEKEMFENIIKV